MKILAIAMLCHAANRAYCEALGDHSQVAWADAPDWQQKSAIEGVNFVLQNPDAPPSASHESWLAVKEADGWKYGAVKDADKKEHPCFVPYDQLPVEGLHLPRDRAGGQRDRTGKPRRSEIRPRARPDCRATNSGDER